MEPPILKGGSKAILEAFRPLLEDPNLPKTSQDQKLAAGMLRRAGIDLQGVTFDTMLASYCVAPGRQGGHGLGQLALHYFSVHKTPTKDVLGTGKKQKTFAEIDIDMVGDYAAESADLTWRIRQHLEPELDELEVTALYRDLELPLTRPRFQEHFVSSMSMPHGGDSAPPGRRKRRGRRGARSSR